MEFKTKKQVLEKILSEKKPKCLHCGEEMTLWEPPHHFQWWPGMGCALLI